MPLTDYNKYKGLCEPLLLRYQSPDFTTVIIRPATVCGYSPRMRFDLTVNILTNHAVNSGVITVFGGEQKRPNIHIDDVRDLYVQLLDMPDELIAGETFNAGYENHTITRSAEMVRSGRRAGDARAGPRSGSKRRRATTCARTTFVAQDRRELGWTAKADDRRRRPRPLRDAFKAGKLPEQPRRRSVHQRQASAAGRRRADQ